MQQLAARDKVRFVVLLIPTKELVFQRRAAGIHAPSYHELVSNEMRFWEETKARLAELGIETVDLLPPLRAQLEVGPQPYQVTFDGHPNETGHRVIAEVTSAYLNAAHTSKPPSETTRDGAGSAGSQPTRTIGDGSQLTEQSGPRSR